MQSSPRPDLSGWDVKVLNTRPAAVLFQAFGICAVLPTPATRVVSTTVTANPWVPATASAQCTGQFPIGGGFEAVGQLLDQIHVMGNTFSDSGTNWDVTVLNTNAVPAQFRSVLVCGDRRGGGAGSTVMTANPGVPVTASATCLGGSVVVGGGLKPVGPLLDQVYVMASAPSSDLSTWQVTVLNANVVSNQFQAIATCASLSRPTAPDFSLTVTPAAVAAGGTVSGRVDLSAPVPFGGLVARLSNPIPNVLSMPSTLSLAQGQSSVSFTINTNAALQGDVTQNITAELGGAFRSAPLAVGQPRLGLNRGTLQFGPQAVGTISSPQTVVVSNTGVVPVTLQNLTINGEFGFATADCSNSASIAAGSQCSINVDFRPTRGVRRSGFLRIATNAVGSPVDVTLSGVGAPLGDLNGSGTVDSADLSLLLARWGTADPEADLDGDGTVGTVDLSLLLGNWS
jgi:hypothetical protein